jgi:hypothetical protein
LDVCRAHNPGRITARRKEALPGIGLESCLNCCDISEFSHPPSSPGVSLKLPLVRKETTSYRAALHLGDNACGEVSKRVVRILVGKHEVQEWTNKSSLNNDYRLTRRSDRRDPTQWEIRVSKNR